MCQQPSNQLRVAFEFLNLFRFERFLRPPRCSDQVVDVVVQRHFEGHEVAVGQLCHHSVAAFMKVGVGRPVRLLRFGSQHCQAGNMQRRSVVL